ncbi:MAG: hypothetical protein G01um101470_1067 [Parcubacteria group bacterium Gr01-1014_70]|nr:MAG: hypothetical protein G01um101470_1067 [Parcubacteria group bacterium Gr01-1014_70]
MFNNIKAIVLFSAVSYSLNFIWEYCHAVSLYVGHRGVAFSDFTDTEYLRLISYVSLVDMLMLAAIFLLGAILWRDFYWFKKMDSRKYSYFLGAALLLAVWVEIKGIYLYHEWAYTQAMPVIFGLGLSPLLQLPVTGLITIFCIKKPIRSCVWAGE